MPLETEIKLAIDPRHLARLAAHPLLKQATSRTRRKLYSVYYDTPDLELWRAGVTLRVRRSDRRWVQTVKAGGSAAAGLHQRMEIETPIAKPAPDFAALATSSVAAQFSSPELRAQLQPVIVTDFIRVSRVLKPASRCCDRNEHRSRPHQKRR